jgi:cytosine/adenosine deaminase-related metal-dependent hydrolase
MAVGVDGGRLVDPDGRVDLTVDAGTAVLHAGLINAHDHLQRNHYGRLGTPPYPDAYTWGRHIHESDASVIARGRTVRREDALLFGALKNLLSGVTTVVHHDPWEPAFERGFPVRVARVRCAHSLGFEPGLAGAHAGDPELPFSMHLAEGTTPHAADEIRALAARGLVDSRLIAVHVVGADADGVDILRDAGACVVWCPTSNEFLFGRTAPAGVLTSGIDVLLGSDSLLTADGTLLEELRAARAHGYLEDATLLGAVGATAARRLGLPAPELTPGARADLALFSRPPLEATPADVELVVVGGVPRAGDERFTELFQRAGVAVQRLLVHGVPRLVAAPLASAVARMHEHAPGVARLLELEAPVGG